MIATSITEVYLPVFMTCELEELNFNIGLEQENEITRARIAVGPPNCPSIQSFGDHRKGIYRFGKPVSLIVIEATYEHLVGAYDTPIV
jgi:hypothetical protein